MAMAITSSAWTVSDYSGYYSSLSTVDYIDSFEKDTETGYVKSAKLSYKLWEFNCLEEFRGNQTLLTWMHNTQMSVRISNIYGEIGRMTFDFGDLAYFPGSKAASGQISYAAPMRLYGQVKDDGTKASCYAQVQFVIGYSMDGSTILLNTYNNSPNKIICLGAGGDDPTDDELRAFTALFDQLDEPNSGYYTSTPYIEIRIQPTLNAYSNLVTPIISDLRGQLNNISYDRDELTSRIDELESENAELTTANNSLYNENKDLRKAFSDLEILYNDLKIGNENLNSIPELFNAIGNSIGTVLDIIGNWGIGSMKLSSVFAVICVLVLVAVILKLIF